MQSSPQPLNQKGRPCCLRFQTQLATLPSKTQPQEHTLSQLLRRIPNTKRNAHLQCSTIDSKHAITGSLDNGEQLRKRTNHNSCYIVTAVVAAIIIFLFVIKRKQSPNVKKLIELKKQMKTKYET